MTGGYNPQHFGQLDSVEDRHFWFQARRRVIGSLARKLTAHLPAGFHVLEVGCGNGSLLPTLQSSCPAGRVIGMDLFLQGLQNARRRTACPLVQGRVESPPFAITFDLIGLFDVLEHLPADTQALSAIHRLLSPGGILLMTVPAHMSLWSYFDELSDHARRYSCTELSDKLIAAGFQVEFLSQFMSLLFPLMWTRRRLTNLNRNPPPTQLSNELKITPGVNALLARLLGSESHLLSRHIHLPLGTSLIAVARKPPAP